MPRSTNRHTYSAFMAKSPFPGVQPQGENSHRRNDLGLFFVRKSMGDLPSPARKQTLQTPFANCMIFLSCTARGRQSTYTALPPTAFAETLDGWSPASAPSTTAYVAARTRGVFPPGFLKEVEITPNSSSDA